MNHQNSLSPTRALRGSFVVMMLAFVAFAAVPMRALSIPGYTLLETITVPTNGSTITSSTYLDLGVGYKLAAFGSFGIGGYEADAEYVYNSTSVYDYYVFGGVDTVDYGIAINDPTVGGLKTPYWGPYSSTHEYIIDFTGLGGTIDLKYHDDYYADNNAPLTLQIFGVETPVGVPEGGTTAALLLVTLAAGAALRSRRA
jgi:hypothetical protein